MRTDTDRRAALARAERECGLLSTGRDVESEAIALSVLRDEQRAAAREGRPASKRLSAIVLRNDPEFVERAAGIGDDAGMVERRSIAGAGDDPLPDWFDAELDLPREPPPQPEPKPADGDADRKDDEPPGAA